VGDDETKSVFIPKFLGIHTKLEEEISHLRK